MGFELCRADIQKPYPPFFWRPILRVIQETLRINYVVIRSIVMEEIIQEDKHPRVSCAESSRRPEPVRRVIPMPLRREEMRRGDILVETESFAQAPWTHRGIMIGQSLTLLGGNWGGESSSVHAMIWIGEKVHHIAHASGKAKKVVKSPLVGAPTMKFVVYRMTREADSSPAGIATASVGYWAARVAKAWAEGHNIPFNSRACLQCIAHLAGWGTNAQQRAERYGRHAFDREGTWAGGGLFCSQFVIACYQAAYYQLGLPMTGMVATDAQHCSVKQLQRRLDADKEFTRVGELYGEIPHPVSNR